MKTFDLGAVTAYALAVKNGFEGTVEEWLESLVPKISVGTVETGEPGSDVVVTMDGNAKTPVLNFRIPRGKPGAVTTVNGMPPDENGNVQVETSSQSDWNAAEGEPGHVLNRTHWTESGGMAEILPECQPTYIPDDGMFSLEFASSLSNLIAGETYIVNWNGTEYPSIAVDGAVIGEPGTFALGDVYTLTEGAVGTAPTGEPFVMAIALEQAVMILPFDGTTELTLSIYGLGGEIVHKLDNKYLDLGWLPTGQIATGMVVVEYSRYKTGSLQMWNNSFLKAGHTVEVDMDGKHYTCTVQDNNGLLYFGDLAVLTGAGLSTGEPFFVSIAEKAVFFKDTDYHYFGAYNESIGMYTRIFPKIPPEYLPTTYNRIVLSNPAGVRYILSVDNSGNLLVKEAGNAAID